MIYLLGFTWLYMLSALIHIWKEGWVGRMFFGVFFAFASFMFLYELRFKLPIEWRARWPKWDAFLCSVGSHRCVPICGSRCCWECIRCNPESPSVKRYFETLSRLRLN